MAQIQIALQLYTVREQMAEDYAGTLQRVKDIGYDVVQLTGHLPGDAAETKAMLDGIGLSVAGIHIDLGELEGNLQHWIDFCKAVGTIDLVCPAIPGNRREGEANWLALAGVLDGIGATCREQGTRLSYHNHSFEFVKFGDRYALDLLYQETSPENLLCEIDTYWIQHGGECPAAYIRTYSGRGPILHIKDMADDEARSFAEIGRGILDWDAIHAASLEAGVECYCVEQDRCAGDPLESARISYEFTKKLIS